MQYEIVGILKSYGDAEAAVEDLEVAGIVGQQVEVISDIDDDARTANTPGEPSTKPDGRNRNWMERLFGAKIYLDLHVKVQPGWREKAAFLNTLDWRTMTGEDDF